MGFFLMLDVNSMFHGQLLKSFLTSGWDSCRCLLSGSAIISGVVVREVSSSLTYLEFWMLITIAVFWSLDLLFLSRMGSRKIKYNLK